MLHASPSPSREDSPILFEHTDQRPLADASDMVSFGAIKDELLDDSMSLIASDAEERLCSTADCAPSSCAEPSDSKPGLDAELLRILSKAVEELELEWSTPEKPICSRLDESFLLGCHQAPRHRGSPFFPYLHKELTKLWHAPYSAHLRSNSSSALFSVVGAEEKCYERMPSLDEAVAAHLCPPTAIGWKAKVAHPSKPCRRTQADLGSCALHVILICWKGFKVSLFVT